MPTRSSWTNQINGGEKPEVKMRLDSTFIVCVSVILTFSKICGIIAIT